MQSPPLAELYDLLRADGFAIGVDDHIRIGRLLARDAAWTLETLRIAIAALVVSDPHEQVAFDACWERWVRSVEAPRAPDVVRLPLPRPNPKTARRLLGIGAAVAVVVAVALASRTCGDGPSTIQIDAAVDSRQPVDAGVDGNKPTFDANDASEAPSLAAPATYPPPDRPPPPARTAIDLALVGLTFGAVVLAIVAIAGAIRARVRRRFLPGPWRFAPAVPPAITPVLPRIAIEDAAAALTWHAPDTGRELDIARSVAATVARGGLPALVYRRFKAVPHHLVLEDTSNGADRWKFMYDELFRGLAREGVELERYTFAASPEQCTGPDGRVVALDDLLDHGDAVIAIGDGEGAVDALTGDRAEWLAVLRHLPRRLWINPVPPARWSAGAQAIAADTPMEHGAARAVATLNAEADRRARADGPYPAVIERAPGTASGIAALRAALGDRAFVLLAAVSVAGPPTIAAVRWLAETHALELDEQDWLSVATLPWFRTEQWPEGLRDRLSEALGAEAPDLARAVAASSERLLAASEPPRDSGAHLAWQLEGAYRAGRRGERAAVVRVLNQVAGTPLAYQARGMRVALGLPDRARRALVSAAALGAALVVGSAGSGFVATRLQSAAVARRATERHLEKLAGEGARLPTPTRIPWPEIFVVRVVDGNGDPVPDARIAWSDPQLGPRSYIAKTDAAGVSRATQIYPSPPRADLQQVAQLITIWNGNVFTDAPVAPDGEKVVFGFAQVAPLECPSDMVHVPGGTFLMGSPDGVGDDIEHPQHQVTLSGYCMDRTEVTVEAYTRCVVSGVCTAALEPAKDGWDSFCNGTRADRKSYPVNCVDWDQATAYCAAVNKRLPSEAEWEYAARGRDGRAYPWGNEAPSAKRLNACGSECRAVSKRLGLGGWGVMYDDNDGWEATAPVGSFQDGESPFGALDMAGNVWEWTADWNGADMASTSTNPHGPTEGTARVIRGGGWLNLDAFRVRGAYRFWVDPADHLSYLGLRCARGD